MPQLVLITREGCCLCAGLEEKLLELGCAFERLDVDADPQLLARFDLEVPVLIARDGDQERVLPRLSPRLTALQVGAWLQQQGLR
ncbi:glutaredoxin family protein [Vulcanococcus sp.]|uniref:glutaredoxin family protein n=1 Tax=Vulcanococcus sp. TaxID=2856995 RepID=UPI003C078FC6